MAEFYDQLQEAFRRVSIVQLLHQFGYADAREGKGLKSLFRDDRKAGSVEIKHNRYRDYACDEHNFGHLELIMHVQHCTKGKAIGILFEAAGLEREHQKPGTVKRVMAEKRTRLFQAARENAAKIEPLGMPEPPPMDAPIRARWNDGKAAIVGKMQELAESRSWPESAMRWLVGQNKTSLPLLPWVDDGNVRGWAFLVERPVFDSRGNSGLVPVGFHIRYSIHKPGQDGQKTKTRQWVYCPYVPIESGPDGKKKNLSDFQRHLIDARLRLPAYPFVLGSIAAPKLVIITEGQFDAVSLAMAFGWIDAEIPPGVVLMALRGVSSPAVLLSSYGDWLRRNKPFVWYIGDNDAAGKTVAAQKGNINAIASEPSFIDRLRAIGCTVYPETITHPGCKDFNDVWRAAPPSIATMRKWANYIGCGDLING